MDGNSFGKSISDAWAALTHPERNTPSVPTQASSGEDAEAAELHFNQGKAAEDRKDYKTAFLLYSKAAAVGYPRAMNNLGLLYKNGQGVAVNDAEAFQWIRKAAEAGDPKAMYNLGMMYGNGFGVAQNDKEAVLWFGKAADAGNYDAKMALLRLMAYTQGAR